MVRRGWGVMLSRTACQSAGSLMLPTMDLSALRELLRGLPHVDGLPLADGCIAIHRRDVIAAGGHADVVERWVWRNGGRVVAAPEPIMSGRAEWRESSRDAVAYVLPSGLLDGSTGKCHE